MVKNEFQKTNKLDCRICLFSILMILLSQASCATTLNWVKGDQLVSIDSGPREAEVYIDGELRGKTPAHIRLKSRKQSSLVIKKDGFVEEIKPLKTEFNIAFPGNILTGGLLGSTTDAVTDNMWKYSPTEYFIQLKPTETNAKETAKWMDKLNRRNFIFSTYRNLVKDIAIGKGKYFDAFCDVSKIACTENVVDELKVISLLSKTPLDFSFRFERRFQEQN